MSIEEMEATKPRPRVIEVEYYRPYRSECGRSNFERECRVACVLLGVVGLATAALAWLLWL